MYLGPYVDKRDVLKKIDYTMCRIVDDLNSLFNHIIWVIQYMIYCISKVSYEKDSGLRGSKRGHYSCQLRSIDSWP